MSVGEEETADLYTPANNDGVNNTIQEEDEILEMFRNRASVNQESAIRQLFYNGHGTNFAAEAQALRDRELPIRFQMVQARWNALNDKGDYLRLRKAIIEVLPNN
jgi:creatinine amidohydrolase/Fe(II)-dependent formamide hydrolase-like protein